MRVIKRDSGVVSINLYLVDFKILPRLFHSKFVMYNVSSQTRPDFLFLFLSLGTDFPLIRVNKTSVFLLFIHKCDGTITPKSTHYPLQVILHWYSDIQKRVLKMLNLLFTNQRSFQLVNR